MVSLSEPGSPSVQGGVGLLERPDTVDPEGPVTVHLVDTTRTPRETLASTETLRIIDAHLDFNIRVTGVACEIRLGDDGPPLWTIPRPDRREVRCGDRIVVHLPAHP